MRSYTETIAYLYSQLPMFSRIGAAAIKKDLHNTIALCAALDHPQHKFKTIHIAGTNGKGSVSHSLAAIFQSAGYKTGLYTSPHLQDFRERIRINGEMIPEEKVITFTHQIQPQIEQLQPSFFEITVAMAFDYFAAEKVDIAIIETGLGGRLDSTNVIHPECAIITNIAFDHMDLLGHTLPEIATEKAGIIKDNTPVVIGSIQSSTTAVFIDKAFKKKASIYWAPEMWTIELKEQTLQHLTAIYTRKGSQKQLIITCDLPGIYQLQNIATVLSAIEVMQLKGWGISNVHLLEGLRNVKSKTGFAGRWELLKNNPAVVLDVAHNEDGMKQMLHQVNRYTQDHSNAQVHFIIGMVRDKDISSVLQLMPKMAKYYFTQSHIPRALPANELQTKAYAMGISGEVFEEVNVAIEKAISNSKTDDLIIVCGSVFLVAEVDRKRWQH